MPDIYEYLDYRKFLRDFYKEKKSLKSGFSYQVFANRAGFKSKSFLVHVMEGKANMSMDSVFGVANVIGLKGKAFHYFENLVKFNQANEPAYKSHFLSLLAGYSKGKKARTIHENEYEFYSTWYHNTIRELITIVNFNADYSFLGRLVIPPITEFQARKSVELLLKLGLIIKKGDKYKQVDKLLTTGDEVKSTAITKFHIENLNLVKQALEKIPVEQREISCIVGGMSENCFSVIKKEVQVFRKKIMEIIENDQEEAEKVYHINFQIVPTSRKKREQ